MPRRQLAEVDPAADPLSALSILLAKSRLAQARLKNRADRKADFRL
jgi:hypothetical protein